MKGKINIDSKNQKWIVSAAAGLTVIIIGLIVIINLFFVTKELKTKKIDEDVYIYFLEDKFEFKGNITLNDGNISDLKLDKEKVSLNSEPIYYKNKEKILLPVNYNLASLASGVQNKVNYYTELVKDDDDFYLVGKNLNYKINNHILFDGSDFYIFVKNTNITFGDQNIEISPLSYANYIYDDKELYVYNYAEDKVYHYENVEGDVFAVSDKFKVNLTADALVINDKDKLLMKNFDYLKKLK